jgi:hypothetical protein
MEKIILDEISVVTKYNELKNIHKVASYFNVSISPIKRVLESNGFQLSNRKYGVNHNFFDNIDSEEKAYWLGFLYADGYIRERKTGNSLELKLSQKDRNHLELFRETIKSNHKIIDNVTKVKYKDRFSVSNMCHLAIYSSKLVESIKKQGIHSKKTFTIDSPKIDETLVNHFLRGYFDGDGSFTFKPENYQAISQMVSASKNFQNFIIDTLNKNDIQIKLYGKINLRIFSKKENVKFYNYIYKNANIFLERKKNTYEKFRQYYKYNN